MSSPYEQSVTARSSDQNYNNKILAELPNEIDIYNFNNQESKLSVLAVAISNQSANGYADGYPQTIKSLTFAVNNKYSVELDFTIGNGSLAIGYNQNNTDRINYLECNNLNQLFINKLTVIDLITKLYEKETINYDLFVKGRYQISWPLSEIIMSQLRIISK